LLGSAVAAIGKEGFPRLGSSCTAQKALKIIKTNKKQYNLNIKKLPFKVLIKNRKGFIRFYF
jgi:hypothetical protein